MNTSRGGMGQRGGPRGTPREAWIGRGACDSRAKVGAREAWIGNALSVIVTRLAYSLLIVFIYI